MELGKKMSRKIPSGFYTLYYLAIKYLVVLAPKNSKDTYMVSFLVSAGACEMDEKNSRKDFDKEKRYNNLHALKKFMENLIDDFQAIESTTIL